VEKEVGFATISPKMKEGLKKQRKTGSPWNVTFRKNVTLQHGQQGASGKEHYDATHRETCLPLEPAKGRGNDIMFLFVMPIALIARNPVSSELMAATRSREWSYVELEAEQTEEA
jgi:hypothetical protein